MFVCLQDWQVAKKKQDLHLDNIEKGLSTLKGIGEAMGETLKTQDVLIDTIDTKVSKQQLHPMLLLLALHTHRIHGSDSLPSACRWTM